MSKSKPLTVAEINRVVFCLCVAVKEGGYK